MPQKDESLFEYWASFSPLAPWVGVDWRFSAMFKSDGATTAKKAVAKAAKSASQVTKEATKLAADSAAKSTARAGQTAAKVVETAAKTTVIASKAVADSAAEAQETFEKVATDAAEIMTKPAGLFAKAPAKIDDLKLIRGVGPKLEAEMNALGIYTFAQIAKFTKANLEWADANLSTIKGRPMRDDWVGQALALMK
jgi:predicted flap endonuclease-1-like 5' DNA nuclease